MSQIANAQYQPEKVNGQVTRSSGLTTDTVVSEETGTIKVGDLLLKSTSTKKGADLPAAAFTFDDLAGIVTRDVTKAQTFRTGAVTYAEDDHVGVMRKGYMAVTITQTVVKNDNLFFVHTAGGASAIHTWRKDLDTNRASKAPVVALEAGVSGDIIEVLVNLDMGIGIV